jgi:hypothetical protein
MKLKWNYIFFLLAVLYIMREKVWFNALLITV